LSKARTQLVLGEILIEVTNEKERQSQVRLLKKYDIDVSDVVYGIASLGTYHAMNRFRSEKFRFSAPRITERAGPGNADQTKIRTAFMGEDPSEQDEKLIQSVEWYRFVAAEKWGYACHHIGNLYKYWLCIGNFEALTWLTQRVHLSHISLSAFNMNLQLADDSQDELEVEDMDINGTEEGAAPKQPQNDTHPLAREGTTRYQLYEKSLVWLQLQQLTDALTALEHWQDDANEVEE
jgi:Nuclear pore protein 84 / 107